MGKGGGGGGGGTHTVINKTELPPWLDQGAQDIFRQAQRVGANLDAPFQGNLVPGFNDFHTRAFADAQAASGLAMPGISQALGSAQGVANFTPDNVSAGNFLSGNVNAYMDPFLENVEAGALRTLNDQRQLALQGVSDSAIRAGGAFGSRHGVREAVTDAEFGRAASDLSAGIRSQGFQNAQAMMSRDQDRALAADQGNQQAGLTGAQLRGQGAFLSGNLANMLQSAGLQGAAITEGIGDRFRDLEGAQLAQDAMQYEAMRNFPIERLQIPLNAIGMIPHGQTTTTTGPAPMTQGANPFMGALGGISSGLGIAQTLGMATGGAGMGIMGGLGGLLGLFSDREEKTDIKKLGKDPQTGLDMYAYRYKGDPKSYPKVVGPMAQDVEKAGGSVTKVGGRRVIRNLGFGGGMPA